MSRFIVTVEQDRECKDCQGKILTGTQAVRVTRWINGKYESKYSHYPQCPPKVSKAVV